MSDQQNAQASFPRRFEGRTVLVTGAGTGFGAEIAVRERAIDKAEQLGLCGSVAVVGGSGVLVGVHAGGLATPIYWFSVHPVVRHSPELAACGPGALVFTGVGRTRSASFGVHSQYRAGVVAWPRLPGVVQVRVPGWSQVRVQPGTW
jgi:hypothetical protein